MEIDNTSETYYFDFGGPVNIRLPRGSKDLPQYVVFRGRSFPSMMLYTAQSVVRQRFDGTLAWVKRKNFPPNWALDEEDEKELMVQILQSKEYE